jgi:Putative collagen-binding domain of a collagenase
VARLAPFANLAGWNFVWEVEGNRESHELGFARRVAQDDVFNHLRTYEDEYPRENYYDLPEYTFAAVENHGIAAPTKDLERNLWRDAWTHHMACLLAYRGKPVYLSEGNSLWRRFWMERVGATQDDLRRAAWAAVTAGASFNWNGHEGEEQLYAGGFTGLPFDNDRNPFTNSARCVDIVAEVMNHEVEFYRMQPHDELLVGQQVLRVYALAEPGRQYLVFAPDGEPFALKLEPGEYLHQGWIDTRSGAKTLSPTVTAQGTNSPVTFSAPDRKTDWVLVLRAK